MINLSILISSGWLRVVYKGFVLAQRVVAPWLKWRFFPEAIFEELVTRRWVFRPASEVVGWIFFSPGWLMVRIRHTHKLIRHVLIKNTAVIASTAEIRQKLSNESKVFAYMTCITCIYYEICKRRSSFSKVFSASKNATSESH